MKIVAVYDSETKTAQILMDGKELENISNVSLCRCEDGYDLNIMRQTMDETGVVNTEGWSCYASKNKISNSIKDLFKKL